LAQDQSQEALLADYRDQQTQDANHPLRHWKAEELNFFGRLVSLHHDWNLLVPLWVRIIDWTRFFGKVGFPLKSP
jgi:hypothetical protein